MGFIFCSLVVILLIAVIIVNTLDAIEDANLAKKNLSDDLRIL